VRWCLVAALALGGTPAAAQHDFGLQAVHFLPEAEQGALPGTSGEWYGYELGAAGGVQQSTAEGNGLCLSTWLDWYNAKDYGLGSKASFAASAAVAWPDASAAALRANAALDLGVGYVSPEGAHAGLGPFALLNGAAGHAASYRFASLVSYQPNLEVGLLGHSRAESQFGLFSIRVGPDFHRGAQATGVLMGVRLQLETRLGAGALRLSTDATDTVSPGRHLFQVNASALLHAPRSWVVGAQVNGLSVAHSPGEPPFTPDWTVALLIGLERGV